MNVARVPNSKTNKTNRKTGNKTNGRNKTNGNKQNNGNTDKDIEFYEKIYASLTVQPSALALYENLRTLDLSHNKLKVIDIPQTSRISHLFLSHNEIYHFNSLPLHLIYLDVSHNQIGESSFQTPLHMYTKMVKLILSYNDMRNLPNKMPHQLVHLECTNSNIVFCDIWAPLLRVLHINNNQLIILRIASCQLSVLDCSHNRALWCLPQFFTNSLRQLNISYTLVMHREEDPYTKRFLNILPDSLEELRMDSCEIEFVPRLPAALRVLYCHDCGIEYFTGLENHPSLEYLDCSNNELTSLRVPPTLKTLHCQDNHLRELHFPYRSVLSFVNCTNNRIRRFTHIPAYISCIKSFLCLNNPFFFHKRRSPFQPITLELLRQTVMAHNIAFVVMRVRYNPAKYRHLILPQCWKTLYTRLAEDKEACLQKAANDDCPICYNLVPTADKCMTLCNHMFCGKCMQGLETSSVHVCPMCRDPLFWKFMNDTSETIVESDGRSYKWLIDMPKSRRFNLRRAFEKVAIKMPPAPIVFTVPFQSVASLDPQSTFPTNERMNGTTNEVLEEVIEEEHEEDVFQRLMESAFTQPSMEDEELVRDSSDDEDDDDDDDEDEEEGDEENDY